MVNPLDLTGRRILVTGASSGIGRACAVLISQLGASVVLVARDTTRLQETQQMLCGSGHVVLPFDLSDTDHYDALFKQGTEGSKLHGLVHAAGLCPAFPLQALSHDIVRQAFEINVFAFIELAKQFSKRKYSEGGSLVAVSSVASLSGWAGGSLYCGTKGALDATVRSLAVELVSKKIRVNSVLPSNIMTPMLEEMLSVGGEAAKAAILAKQPLGIGEPLDVANAVAFLLSDASRFITGTHLVVDGGYLAQ
ncbi:MAG: SDR family NAD(P)-dependent oxidoreductase [Kiritimatiellia bacterium]|jgi:NAD(P)-dependent dehydrogenase (short-subunit alcohol dehydrogenase family)